MSGDDFGADVDAALKGHIEAIRAAAGTAKERVDEGIAGVPVDPHPAFSAPPAAPVQAPHGAAVDFDIEETPADDEAPLDTDGVPPPEEI